MDELTHFTWEEYSYVMSRNRPNGPGTRVYMRATANPGGVGHGWVKARFISPAPPGTRMVQLVNVKTPDGKEITRRRTRIFIPSTVFDNPALMENDPGYIGTLASLPEAERQALLYGNWDSFSGQVFTEWRNDPAHYDDQRWTHVIRPFRIPAHWKIWRGYDFGYSRPFSVGWYAADEEGRLYRIKELYGCTGTPNEGLRIDPVEQARRIREAEQNDPMLKGRVILGVADPAIFNSMANIEKFPLEARGETVSREALVQAALHEITQNYREASLSNVARSYGVSLAYVSECVRAQTGKTYKELLQKHRMETAARLLRRSDWNIQQIITYVGYENTSYFYRLFHERYGVSPREYRRSRTPRVRASA